MVNVPYLKYPKMNCYHKIDGNKFSIFLNFFDVISKCFFYLFSIFVFYVLSFYIMSFLYFSFSMFCRSMFRQRPDCTGSSESTLAKCLIVGYHMSRLIYSQFWCSFINPFTPMEFSINVHRTIIWLQAMLSVYPNNIMFLLNPFMRNVFSNPYQLDKSISNFRVVGWYFSFLFF